MSKIVKVEVPDIGDFTNVDIIEVLVTPGDQIAAEDALITLESDKATIEIPSPQAGTVKEVLVKVNDKVSQGDVILTMELSTAETPSTEATEEQPAAAEEPAASEPGTAPAAQAAPLVVATYTSKSSCWVQVRAAIPPPSVLPTWASR